MADTELMFGLKRGVPPASAKWGGRFIVTQDGHVDLPPGRASIAGDGPTVDALLKLMDERLPQRKLFDLIADKLRCYDIGTREEKLHTLFDDGDVVILGNTNASAGYLYITAFRRCDTFGAETPDEYREKPPGAIDPLPKYMSEEQYTDLMANYD